MGHGWDEFFNKYLQEPSLVRSKKFKSPTLYLLAVQYNIRSSTINKFIDFFFVFTNIWFSNPIWKMNYHIIQLFSRSKVNIVFYWCKICIFYFILFLNLINTSNYVSDTNWHTFYWYFKVMQINSIFYFYINFHEEGNFNILHKL